MIPDDARPVRAALHSAFPAQDGPGVSFIGEGTVMAKATGDGVYVTEDGSRFIVRTGDPIPEGATFEPYDAKPAKADAKAKGPSETTKAAGPSEKA